MGVIRQGILGGFSGKVGTVVGSYWNGVWYMRALPQSHGAHTMMLLETEQQCRFAVVSEFLLPLLPVIREGFKNYGIRRMSAYNAAMSHALKNAVTGDYPEYRIDYSKVLLAKGPLATAAEAAVGLEEGSIHVNWADNSSVSGCEAGDQAWLILLNRAKRCYITDTAHTRQSGNVTCAVPSDWFGDTVQAFLFFRSADGKKRSNSVFVGETNLPETH
ncbi:MAG: hypothetical protein IJM65_04510 [Bacteroidales bacterium]|nr:hypothetical protein [Bacteroidales bacterium]